MRDPLNMAKCSRNRQEIILSTGYLLIYKTEIVRVCVSCVSSLIARERINRFAPDLTCLVLETRKRFQKGQNSEKVSLVRKPERLVSVSWKLCTIEEHRQEQSCLFRRVDYRNNGYNPEKLSWVRVSMTMVSVARKLSTI
jgi:hypothetical protein